jgi:hypothetical protein
VSGCSDVGRVSWPGPPAGWESAETGADRITGVGASWLVAERCSVANSPLAGFTEADVPEITIVGAGIVASAFTTGGLGAGAAWPGELGKLPTGVGAAGSWATASRASSWAGRASWEV